MATTGHGCRAHQRPKRPSRLRADVIVAVAGDGRAAGARDVTPSPGPGRAADRAAARAESVMTVTMPKTVSPDKLLVTLLTDLRYWTCGTDRRPPRSAQAGHPAGPSAGRGPPVRGAGLRRDHRPGHRRGRGGDRADLLPVLHRQGRADLRGRPGLAADPAGRDQGPPGPTRTWAPRCAWPSRTWGRSCPPRRGRPRCGCSPTGRPGPGSPGCRPAPCCGSRRTWPR